MPQPTSRGGFRSSQKWLAVLIRAHPDTVLILGPKRPSRNCGAPHPTPAGQPCPADFKTDRIALGGSASACSRCCKRWRVHSRPSANTSDSSSINVNSFFCSIIAPSKVYALLGRRGTVYPSILVTVSRCARKRRSRNLALASAARAAQAGENTQVICRALCAPEPGRARL